MKRFSLLLVLLVVGVMLGSIAVSAQDNTESSLKGVIETIVDEAWNNGNYDVVYESMSPDYTTHTPVGDLQGADALVGFLIDNFRSAMPDFTMTIDVLIAQDNWTATRATVTGTFTEDFMGFDTVISPTDESIQLALNVIDRFDENGQIVEEWIQTDNFIFLQQIGVIPSDDDVAESTAIMMEEMVSLLPESLTSGMEVENSAIAIRIFDEAINGGNSSVLDDIVADELTHREAGREFDLLGWKLLIGIYRTAMPDLELSPEIVLAEGDYVAVHYVIRGTQTGNLLTPDGNLIPPTDAAVEIPANAFLRFNEEGQLVDTWVEFDQLTLLTQLGLFELDAT